MKGAFRVRAGAAALLALALWWETAGAAEHALTLDRAIGMALEKNEALRIARESVASAAAALSGARGAYEPRLGLDGTWRRSNVPVNSALAGATPSAIAPRFESTGIGASIRQLLPTGGELTLSGAGGRETADAAGVLLSPAWPTRVGAELRQPLLRERGMDAARRAVRVARAGRREANASLERALSEMVAAVERAYWELAAARMGVTVRAEAVRLAEEQLAETRVRVRSRSAPETELAQPRAELERRRGELLAARASLARAENSLKLLTLAEGDDALWASELVPADSVAAGAAGVDVTRSLARALAARPELEEGEALVDGRRAQSAFARDAAWPALDVVASYDRFGLAGSMAAGAPGGTASAGLEGSLARSFETLGDGEFDAARVALVLELPVWNRSARAELAQARSAERQAEMALARTRKAIRAEVLDAVAALGAARQRIEAARSGREAAEVQLAAERDRYASGLSTNFLVLTRQNDLSRARLDEISALTDYRTARTELARATGSLIEERGLRASGAEHSGGSR